MGDHRVYAAVYDRVMAPVEAAGLQARRRRLLSQARGRVLDVGAGTGLNLAHYPAGQVMSVVALEPDGAMRKRLGDRLAITPPPVPVEVRAGGLEDLDPGEGAFDTVVCTLVLCTVGNVGRAVAAIDRVLAPDGAILYLEHVAVPGVRGRVQRMATPFWRHLAGGCHLDRDPVMAFVDAGLAVTDCERFDLPRTSSLVSSAAQGRASHRHGADGADGADGGGGAP